MNDVAEIYRRLKAALPPHPFTERDPYRVLTFAMLSTRTRDEVTLEVAARLWERYPDIASLARADPEEVASVIRGVGFHRQKARNLVEAARLIMEVHGGRVPDNVDDLTSLPGVGRKVANVVLSTAFGRSVIAVDTHVHRISNRMGLVSTDNPRETEEALMRIVPPEIRADFNPTMVVFGRTICRPTRPRCHICPVADLCERRL
jgi:endonuclease-3